MKSFRMSVMAVAAALLALNASAQYAIAQYASPGGAGSAPKAGGIIDDSTKPAGNGPASRGGIWDDSTKPAGNSPTSRGGIFDDSTRPVAGGQKARGGVFDDSTKPVAKPGR